MKHLRFNPEDDRSMTRERYYRGRRLARLAAFLKPPASARQQRVDDLVRRLADWPGARFEDIAKLQDRALAADACTAVDGLLYFEAVATRYMAGDRFCAMCDELAPLRDGECPDCCH